MSKKGVNTLAPFAAAPVVAFIAWKATASQPNTGTRGVISTLAGAITFGILQAVLW